MKIASIALISSLLLASKGVAKEQTVSEISQDEAAIITIVESVGTFADRGEFDALSRLYAEEFSLDYSSLNGQEKTIKNPIQLMTEWSAVLPGFDRTRHALSDIEVNIDGEKAKARAEVDASHWINDLFWQVAGNYEYELSNVTGDWKITSMRFNLANETGTREVFGPAIEAAQTKELAGNSLAVASRNKAAVLQFFRALENSDIPAFLEFFAKDGAQINPYNAGIFPVGANGISELKAYWTPVPDLFEDMRFPIDEISGTEDPNVIFVRYRGELKLKDGAGVYQNTYYSTFRFNKEGKISEYVEIFDPVVAARSFGLIDQIK